FEARLARRFGRALTMRRAGEGTREGAGDTGAATGPNASGADAHLRRAVAALQAFLDGDLGAFEDLPLDLVDRSAWDRRVFAAVRGIPPGSTASYGQVARMAGSPGAARAVGGAVGRNPIGLAIPCHRVIAGDGTLGGYGGGWWGGRATGLALKRELLAREGVHLDTPDLDGPRAID
ncbi:MAG TPA: MGMT family protein, partial [Candidatus Binatia bacterium]|nr:MGMT family protein [Candidatus Binatia bacterium]